MQQRVVAVTGANGFIGLHIVNKFLSNNFKVIATVRDANDQNKTKDLKNLKNQQNLQIMSADLFNKSNFVEIFKQVDSVIHNASPLISSDNEDDFVKPALAGVQNVIEAILELPQGKIRNLVFTSSMAAVCGAPGSKPSDHVFSEKDWSNPDNQRERKAWYALSKTLAEQKVLSYEEQLKQNGITLTRICPTLVLGPLLQTSGINASVKPILGFLNGERKEIPQFSMSLVDVRDIAEMNYQAIVKNKEGRFIGVEKGYTYEQIAEMIRKFAGPYAKNITSKVAEGEKAVPSLFDLEKTYDLVGRKLITADESIKETIDSIISNKLI